MWEQNIDFFKLLPLVILLTFFGFSIFEFKSFKFKFSDTPLYLTLSLVVVGLTSFFSRFINIPSETIWLFIFLVCVLTLFKTSWEKIEFKKPFILFVIFLTVSITVISGTSFFEGFTKEGNLMVRGTKAHDGFWHIALEESIKKSMPPENPIFYGEKLKNYHYLTDVLISSISEITHISTINLFFRWLPFVFGFLLISTTFLLFFQLTKNTTLSYLGSSLMLFSSSLSYIAPYFFKNASVHQSTFWLDQSTRYLVNPQLTFSLIVMNVIFILVFRSIKQYWVIIAILTASLIGIKVYGFIVLLFSFFLIGLYLFIKENNLSFLKISFLGGILAFIIVSLAGVSSDSPFIYQPGWFVTTMYQASDRLNFSQWEIHRQLFLETSNYRRLILHWGDGILVFLAGNFGLKILGLISGLLLLRKIKQLAPVILLSIAVSFISILLPMFFIQKGIVWNTIQAMHYAQVPLVILIIYFVRKFAFKYQLIILIIILTIGLPATISEVSSNFQPKSYTIFSKELVEGIGMISKIAPTKTILVSSSLYDSSIISAIGKREVYYADPTILAILRINALDRQFYIDKIESGNQNCRESEVLISKRDANVASNSALLLFENNEIAIVNCTNLLSR